MCHNHLMGRMERDPVSELWDAAARRLLDRAYQNPTRTARTRLADPTPAQRQAILSAYGIDVDGPDDVRGQRAHTRWARAFVRSIYYQHKWYYRRGAHLGAARRTTETERPLRVTVGRRLPIKGVIPAGRMITVEVLPGGRAKQAALDRTPAAERYIAPGGTPGQAWNQGPETRDWEDLE